jgi:LytTr DNA-binding domain
MRGQSRSPSKIIRGFVAMSENKERFFINGFLVVKKRDAVHKIASSDIFAVEASFKYQNVYSSKGMFMVDAPAKCFAAKLADFGKNFVQAKRGCWLNKLHIDTVKYEDLNEDVSHSQWVFTLSSGQKFVASRRLGSAAAIACGYKAPRKSK